MSFQIGTRVRWNSWEGTILSVRGSWYGVAFDENIGGHSLDGLCQDGHGLFVQQDFLECELPDDFDIPDDMGLLL